MPFLFVDYDQGAGGEFFCASLSESPECISLRTRKYPSGRTKVHDVFHQEFLKPRPNAKILVANADKYEIVPTHKHTAKAAELLGDIKSIRIANPVDDAYWKFLKKQQIDKVLLSIEPSGEEFIGMVKILQETAVDTNFVRKIKHGMDTLSLQLLSKGLVPSEENRANFIDQLYIKSSKEPEFDYDLIIKYEDLFLHPEQVKVDLEKTFGITIISEWLLSFKQQYDAYTKT
tara:strand:- start:2965 stop:3657 length:693 start_codon:yes stop_codon:yes gene_type:complete